MAFTRASVSQSTTRTSCCQVIRAHGGSLNLIKDLTAELTSDKLKGDWCPRTEKKVRNKIGEGKAAFKWKKPCREGDHGQWSNTSYDKVSWVFVWNRTVRIWLTVRCFWGPTSSRHQMASQQYRTLVFPLLFLPQNGGCSFLLSDATHRAAQQQTIWTQRANIRGSASPTNSLQIHPPLHLCLCIRNGLIHTKKPFNQKISFHHSL